MAGEVKSANIISWPTYLWNSSCALQGSEVQSCERRKQQQGGSDIWFCQGNDKQDLNSQLVTNALEVRIYDNGDINLIALDTYVGSKDVSFKSGPIFRQKKAEISGKEIEYWTSKVYRPFLRNSKNVVVADVNGDGYEDIVVSTSLGDWLLTGYQSGSSGFIPLLFNTSLLLVSSLIFSSDEETFGSLRKLQQEVCLPTALQEGVKKNPDSSTDFLSKIWVGAREVFL